MVDLGPDRRLSRGPKTARYHGVDPLAALEPCDDSGLRIEEMPQSLQVIGGQVKDREAAGHAILLLAST